MAGQPRLVLPAQQFTLMNAVPAAAAAGSKAIAAGDAANFAAVLANGGMTAVGGGAPKILSLATATGATAGEGGKGNGGAGIILPTGTTIRYFGFYRPSVLET